MKPLLFRYLDPVLSSYWFIPALMAFGAVALSFIMVGLDIYFGSSWLEDAEWVYLNEPDGAQELLSTIAGSMITVAGVVFSITTVTIAQTALRFGPRLLTNFMQDRGNQITLGTFIATFLYCLLVLRTVRGGEDGAGVFVPHIAVFGALFLALASLSVLIYFIHHVPESIHVSNLVGNVGRQLNERLRELYVAEPDRDEVDEAGHGPEAAAAWPERFDAEAVPVSAGGTGYVLFLDDDGLMACACEHDLRFRLRQRPGSFVSDERALVLAWPGHCLSGDVAAKVRRSFVLGARRSPSQDVSFLVHRLIEVAARALSPGVNDLYTATNAMDWLGSALANLAGHTIPPAHRYDRDGALRVVAEAFDFEVLADEIFDQLRPYVQADRNAALHLMKVIGRVAEAARTDTHRVIVLRHAVALREACEASLTPERDRVAIRDAHAAVVGRLARVPPA